MDELWTRSWFTRIWKSLSVLSLFNPTPYWLKPDLILANIVKLEWDELTILELFLVLKERADVISEIASIKALFPLPFPPVIKFRVGDG